MKLGSTAKNVVFLVLMVVVFGVTARHLWQDHCKMKFLKQYAASEMEKGAATHETKLVGQSEPVQANDAVPTKLVDKPIASSPAPVLSKSENWRAIQEKVTDAVVQVFSQIAEFDFLEPYKTPSQYSAYGSAFFINEDGYLITNAHVVMQATSVWIQIPSLGKRIIDVEVVGVSPERDIALLRLTPEMVALVRKELGAISYLEFGDSDLVRRADEVLALGYPLGQQSLKSTSGVISGREGSYIQMSAPINPGSSGGPLLNQYGQVVGVNSAGVTSAQNVGYIIPGNNVGIIIPDLQKVTLLRKPYIGVLFNHATESLSEYFGNPDSGGPYIVEIIKNSPLYKAGVQRGDVIYEIDGYPVDMFGYLRLPWSEDRVALVDYVSRLAVGQEINIVVYRDGTRKQFTVTFDQSELPAIRMVYPGYEEIDYEVAAGMVVMQLTVNHINGLKSGVPGLARFSEMNQSNEPVLIITHIFPNSQLHRSRVLTVGSTLNEVNGVAVHTLDDLRRALKKPVKNKFITIKASDNVARASDNIFVVLPFAKVAQEERVLARLYHYDVSDTARDLIKLAETSSKNASEFLRPSGDTAVA